MKEIANNATCNSLDLIFDLACPIYLIKKEQELKLVKEGVEKLTNYRLKNKKNKCEQR